MAKKFLLALLLFHFVSFAKVIQTVPNALGQIFPGKSIQVKEKRVFLNKMQVQSVFDAMGENRTATSGAMMTYFEGKKEGDVYARAYLDRHVIRKESESVLIAIGGDGALRGIYILSFDEPIEYKPPEKWLKQFQNISKTQSKKSFFGITGATLTSDVLKKTVRKVLLIDEIVRTKK